MKPINEFTEQDGILIETEQESQEIRELLHGMGLKWCTGTSYLKYKPSYLPVVIYPKQGGNSREPWAKHNNLTLHPASDYIIKPGDEVEVRDGGGDKWYKSFYIGKNKKGYFVTEDEDGYIESWKHIRKEPNPKSKSKAIAEIKKIAEENGINLKEI
jgi:hypothetical protein